VAIGVAYLAVTRRDVQPAGPSGTGRRPVPEMVSGRPARDGY
jgi:hypothetical protein